METSKRTSVDILYDNFTVSNGAYDEGLVIVIQQS